MRNLCPYLLLVVVSEGINVFLFGTFAISFIILYSIVNLFYLIVFFSQVRVLFLLRGYILGSIQHNDNDNDNDNGNILVDHNIQFYIIDLQ